MMMPTVIIVMAVSVAAVSTAFRLEGNLRRYKIRSKTPEHLLDHMIGPNAKNPASNFSRQMAVSQMPGKAHQLIGIFMSHFDNKLRSGLNLEPPPIFKLQSVSIGHRDRFREVEEDVFAVIGRQANAAAMARVEIESERSGRFFLRPMPGLPMNRSEMHRHIST
jgi:hypothetical protein